MKHTHIAIVIGTARVDRATERAARAVEKVASMIEGCSTELVDVRDHVAEAVTMPPWGAGGADEVPTAWREIVEKSNALILVTPEYNHGYPGELKLLLDSLWDTYAGKPVGLVGVTGGSLGAARVIDHSKPVLLALGLRPIVSDVHVSKVTDVLKEDGSVVDESLPTYMRQQIEELIALTIDD